MSRLPRVLEREIVACQKTLEQKISDAGPAPQRVDPHLVGLAIRELLEKRRLHIYQDARTGSMKWYAYARTPEDEVRAKLDEIAPLYAHITGTGFKNHIGDALEIIVYKSLLRLREDNRRYTPLGYFDLDSPRNRAGRYKKTEPQANIAGTATSKVPDFMLLGFDTGPICIECKNYREWLYPDSKPIHDLIEVALDLEATPLLIARRFHYTAIRNFLEPAGILAHESLYQYYPGNQTELAEQVKHKRSLGFFDIKATEDPHPRTVKFFREILPRIADRTGRKFMQNKDALRDYIGGDINLAQLYNAIGSPAAGNWVDWEEEPPDEF